MKKLIQILLLISISHILFAQQEQDFDVLIENQIKEIRTYFFMPNNTQDSVLSTIEKFNLKGRVLQFTYFEKNGRKKRIEYTNLHDTVRTNRKTFFNNDWISQDTLVYNEYNNEIYTIGYDTLGHESGWRSTTRYNKNQQKFDSKIYFRNDILNHVKKKYHKNGQLKQIKYKKPKRFKRTEKFDANGIRITNKNISPYILETTFDNYRFEGDKMIKTIRKDKVKRTITGIHGKLILQPDDILIIETFYLQNGLINFKVQYVNSNKIGTQKYKYYYK